MFKNSCESDDILGLLLPLMQISYEVQSLTQRFSSLCILRRWELHPHGGHWYRAEASGAAGSTRRRRQRHCSTRSSQRPAEPGHTR